MFGIKSLALNSCGIVAVHTIVSPHIRSKLELFRIIQNHIPTVSNVVFAINWTIREHTRLTVAGMISSIHSVCLKSPWISTLHSDRAALRIIEGGAFANPFLIVPHSVSEASRNMKIVSLESRLRDIFDVHLFVNMSSLAHCFIVIHVYIVLELSRLLTVLNNVVFQTLLLHLKMCSDLVHILKFFLVLRHHCGIYRRFGQLFQ